MTLGTLGDVLPLAVLGAGLRDAGHQVRVGTHAEFQDVVTDRGLEFSQIVLNPSELLDREEARAWLASHNKPLRFMQGLVRAARPAIRRMGEDALAACADTDVVIFTALGMVGYHVATYLQLPHLLASLWPITPTGSFPSILAPAGLRLGRHYNKLTHLATEQAFWQPWRSNWNAMRRSLLGLPPLPLSGIGPELRRHRVPALYGFSPSVLPKPADWPEWAHTTGYWFSEPAREWQPPAALTSFLGAGPPPVGVGFSSLKVNDPQGLTDTVVTALRQSGRRGILLTGWGALVDGDYGDDILVIRSVPHDYLFQRVVAMVHPCGAGTSAACLRAGLPSVVLPSFADQFFWARRLEELGVSAPRIRWRQLSVDRLADAITYAVSSASVRDAATAISRKIAAEDGIGRAIEVIEKVVSEWQSTARGQSRARG